MIASLQVPVVTVQHMRENNLPNQIPKLARLTGLIYPVPASNIVLKENNRCCLCVRVRLQTCDFCINGSVTTGVQMSLGIRMTAVRCMNVNKSGNSHGR